MSNDLDQQWWATTAKIDEELERKGDSRPATCSPYEIISDTTEARKIVIWLNRVCVDMATIGQDPRPWALLSESVETAAKMYSQANAKDQPPR